MVSFTKFFLLLQHHSVPLEGLPCMSYKLALEEEERVGQEKEAMIAMNGSKGSAAALPKATVKTYGEVTMTKTVKPQELNEYCKDRFRFRVLKTNRFK